MSLAREIREVMIIILTGDFNINVKDNYNAGLVELMGDTSKLDVLWDLSEGTTRSNLLRYGLWTRCGQSCKNYVSYFSSQRSILSISNHKTPQHTDVTTN
jgi:hypothetical protein